MQSFKSLTTITALVLTLAFNITAFAGAGFNQSFKLKGTVSGVDLDNNTFTVFHVRTNVVKTYSLPENVKVIVDGKTFYDLSVIKPGQSVTLKFKQEKADPTSASDKARSESLTIRGMVIEIDKKTMSGTLREARTNKVIKFRYADHFKKSDLSKPGEFVVFTYHMESVTLTSAN